MSMDILSNEQLLCKIFEWLLFEDLLFCVSFLSKHITQTWHPSQKPILWRKKQPFMITSYFMRATSVELCRMLCIAYKETVPMLQQQMDGIYSFVARTNQGIRKLQYLDECFPSSSKRHEFALQDDVFHLDTISYILNQQPTDISIVFLTVFKILPQQENSLLVSMNLFNKIKCMLQSITLRKHSRKHPHIIRLYLPLCERKLQLKIIYLACLYPQSYEFLFWYINTYINLNKLNETNWQQIFEAICVGGDVRTARWLLTKLRGLFGKDRLRPYLQYCLILSCHRNHVALLHLFVETFRISSFEMQRFMKLLLTQAISQGSVECLDYLWRNFIAVQKRSFWYKHKFIQHAINSDQNRCLDWMVEKGILRDTSSQHCYFQLFTECINHRFLQNAHWFLLKITNIIEDNDSWRRVVLLLFHLEQSHLAQHICQTIFKKSNGTESSFVAFLVQKCVPITITRDSVMGVRTIIQLLQTNNIPLDPSILCNALQETQMTCMEIIPHLSSDFNTCEQDYNTRLSCACSIFARIIDFDLSVIRLELKLKLALMLLRQLKDNKSLFAFARQRMKCYKPILFDTIEHHCLHSIPLLECAQALCVHLNV